VIKIFSVVFGIFFFSDLLKAEEPIPENPTDGMEGSKTQPWFSEKTVENAAIGTAVGTAAVGLGVGVHQGWQNHKKNRDQLASQKPHSKAQELKAVRRARILIITSSEKLMKGGKPIDIDSLRNLWIMINGVCLLYTASKNIGERIGEGMYKICNPKTSTASHQRTSSSVLSSQNRPSRRAPAGS
jgi:hypothetical protein